MNSSKKTILVIILLLLVLLTGGAGGYLYYQIFVPQFNITEPASLYIDNDDNIDSVQVKMIRSAVPKNTIGYTLLYKVRPFQVNTGHYLIVPTDNYRTLHRKLSHYC